MGRTGDFHPGLFHESGDPVADIGGTEARAVAAEEKRGFGGQVGEERPDFREVFLQPPRGAFPNRQQPALAGLALAHQQGAGGGIEIAVVETGHFRAPHAGGVENARGKADRPRAWRG